MLWYRVIRSSIPVSLALSCTVQTRKACDLDLLVDPLPGTTLFDLGGLQVALEDLLGVPVDVVTPGDLPARIRAQVVAEARPL